MFEVGKKYISRSAQIIEVLNATKDTAHIRILESRNMTDLLKEQLGLEHCYKQSVFSPGKWKEYFEPKITIQDIFLKKEIGSGNFYATRNSNERRAGSRLFGNFVLLKQKAKGSL